MMKEEEIRVNFSKNLLQLRKSKDLSQAELASELNYTDKAVSKWENQETIPDIVTLSNIASYFNITVDQLISSKEVIKESNKEKRHARILLSSIILCFVIVGIVYLIMHLSKVNNDYYIFPFAPLSSSIVAIVLTALWYRRIHLFVSISTCIWSVALVVMIFLNFSYFYIVLIIALLLDIAFYPFLKLFKK